MVVGRSGVGPKQEGDGRSPEGLFGLGPVFGYSTDPPPGLGSRRDSISDGDSRAGLSSGVDPGAGQSRNPGPRLPYEPTAPLAVCVDDVGSAFYNLVFDADTLSSPKDWTSAEAMRRDLAHGDDLYKWGIQVRYSDPPQPGAGSCIFLHIWRGPGSPTAGCTAMAENDLLSLFGWLTEGAVLVQGTRAYLEGLREEGLLPYRIPPTP